MKEEQSACVSQSRPDPQKLAHQSTLREMIKESATTLLYQPANEGESEDALEQVLSERDDRVIQRLVQSLLASCVRPGNPSAPFFKRPRSSRAGSRRTVTDHRLTSRSQTSREPLRRRASRHSLCDRFHLVRSSESLYGGQRERGVWGEGTGNSESSEKGAKVKEWVVRVA